MMVRWAAAYLITLKGSLRREDSVEELSGQLLAEEIEVWGVEGGGGNAGCELECEEGG